MKKTICILILSMMFVSPLYADYDRMRKELENYTPPESFTILVNSATLKEKKISEDPEKTAPVMSEIKGLKKAYERKVSNTDQSLVEIGLNKKILARMSAVASDSKTARERIQHKVILEEIQALAALRNPSILAAREKVRAELQSFDQVMDLDDMLRQYSAFTKAVNNKIGPIKAKDSIKMSYPFPGLTALKGRIVQKQADLLTEKMKIATKQVVTDTEKAYWNLVFIEKSTQITLETIAAFNRLKDVATTLYKSGKTSFQDVIKVNIKIEELREDLVTLASRKKTIGIKIIELLNLPVKTRLGRTVIASIPPKTPNPEHLYPIARKHRQELKAIRFQIAKLEHMVEMSESMALTPTTLGFSSFDNDNVITAGIGAPKEAFASKTMAAMKNNSPSKPWFGINEPWLRQTRQNLLSLRQVLIEKENATDRMVRDAWFKTDKDRREFYLYSNRILPLSQSALDVSTREYESGSIPFSQAIGSYTDWLKVKLTIAKKQADLGTSMAQLENIIGKKL